MDAQTKGLILASFALVVAAVVGVSLGALIEIITNHRRRKHK